jgi:hypothetical protein
MVTVWCVAFSTVWCVALYYKLSGAVRGLISNCLVTVWFVASYWFVALVRGLDGIVGS